MKKNWCFHFTRWQYLWYSQQKNKYPLYIFTSENITFSKYTFYFINKSLYFITLYIIKILLWSLPRYKSYQLVLKTPILTHFPTVKMFANYTEISREGKLKYLCEVSSLFLVPCFVFLCLVPCYLFLVPCYLFLVPCYLFPVIYSLLFVTYSLFLIPSSLLLIPCFFILVPYSLILCGYFLTTYVYWNTDGSYINVHSVEHPFFRPSVTLSPPTPLGRILTDLLHYFPHVKGVREQHFISVRPSVRTHKWVLRWLYDRQFQCI